MGGREDCQGQAAVMLLKILSEPNVSGFSSGQVGTQYRAAQTPTMISAMR